MILLAGIFSSPIEPGAQLFLLIVCILIGLGAGISAADARSTFAKKKKSDH
jgi:F0F1-type ATP synthase assembly protein I